MHYFVVDASVALCWYFEDQATAFTEAIFECLEKGDQACVPSLWPLEMVNALVIAWRKKGITSVQLHHFITDLKDLPIEIFSRGDERAYSSILALSCQYQLSSYDAAYLDLALSEALPIATADKNLRAAAKRSNVELFDPR